MKDSMPQSKPAVNPRAAIGSAATGTYTPPSGCVAPVPVVVGGVSDLNGITGSVALIAGANVSISPVGQDITISSTGTGGGPGGYGGISHFQDVSLTRQFNTIYTNGTGLPMMVTISVQVQNTSSAEARVNNTPVAVTLNIGSSSIQSALSFWVLPGNTYQCNTSGAGTGLSSWIEWY